MEKIKFKDINFAHFYELQHQGATATLYKQGNICIKILDKYSEENKEKLYRKFLDMDGIKIDNVLLPKALIVDDNKLQGYLMDYFPNSNCLSEKFTTQFVDSKLVLQYVSQASKILRNIHKNGILFQDLSFENILVNKEGKVVFCDIDSCRYKNHTAPFISLLMHDFFVGYRDDKILISENLDRISMMLSLFYLMYEEEIQFVSRRRYNKLSKKIITLQNLKSYFNALKNIHKPIGDVPYLDDLIDLRDDCVYDRDKQLTFRDRMLREIKNRINY